MDVTEQVRMLDNIKCTRNDEAIARALSAMNDEIDLSRSRNRSRSPQPSRADRSRSRERAIPRSGSEGVNPLRMNRMQGVGKECNICLREMKGSEKRCVVGCGNAHVFHDACLRKWFRVKKQCPVCREDVSSSRSTVVNR